MLPLFPPSIHHEVMGPDAMILVFLNVEFQVSFFSLLFSPSSRGSLVPLYFLPLEWHHLHIWVVDICPGNLDSIL